MVEEAAGTLGQIGRALEGRYRLEAEIGPEYEALLEVLAAERERMRAAGLPTEVPGWRTALESGMLERLLDGDVAGAEELLRSCLSSSSA